MAMFYTYSYISININKLTMLIIIPSIKYSASEVNKYVLILCEGSISISSCFIIGLYNNFPYLHLPFR